MTVLAVLTVFAVLEMESTLASFCLSYKIQHNETTVAVLAVSAVSVMTATPVKLKTPLSVILIGGQLIFLSFWKDPRQPSAQKLQDGQNVFFVY